MNFEDLKLIAQIVESIDDSVGELEKAFEKQDAIRLKQSKEEILKFQKKMGELLG